MANGFKTGGREKGTPNKGTLALRQKLQTLLELEIDSGRIEEELATLTGKEYLAFIIKLSSFVVPKVTKEEAIAEKEPTKNVFVMTPVATKEEVEIIRGKDYDEDTLAKLIFYTEKKKIEHQQMTEIKPVMWRPPGQDSSSEL